MAYLYRILCVLLILGCISACNNLFVKFNGEPTVPTATTIHSDFSALPDATTLSSTGEWEVL